MDASELGGAASSRRMILLAGLSMLSGCATLLPPKETKLVVRVGTAPNVNPSPSGVPSPLLLRVYTLRADTKFLQSDTQSLYDNDAAILGTDLLSKHEFILPPSAKDGFTATVPADATVVGVVAGFRQLDVAQWRAVAPIKFADINIATIAASDLAVTLTVQTEPKAWPF
ncbi:MAG: type VI secretion system lipoprotein TssJ [Methylobacterium frigidaeris]